MASAGSVVFPRAGIFCLSLSLVFSNTLAAADGVPAKPTAPAAAPADEEKPDDGGLTPENKAAIVAAIIAGSVALYLARGKPCACPYSTMRNGAACGSRSAWSKPGGAKPLCFPTDITADMISAYAASKAIPGL